MQNTTSSTTFLLNYCNRVGFNNINNELQMIETLTDRDSVQDKGTAISIKQALETIRNKLAANRSSEFNINHEYALHATDALIQAMGSYDRGEEDYMSYRDRQMADNIAWMIALEEKIGSGKVMISGHDGHISKSWLDGSKTLGGILEEMYGEQYFAIGTDFFTADVNINTSSMISDHYTRNNHHFCSADPLAFQARYFDNGSYYLDFSSVPSGLSLYDQIHTATHMANIGEGYMWVWYLFPDSAYRPAQIPQNMYDGMIYVYKANPIYVF